ncbi:phage tail assembly protein [Roseomonas sp. HJA6]|uniref:Phage tail assembly protein n=1 Tax=Roseomonas alba TaxID=2846776 RepID=A0ABS7ACE4_9PROT|nr:phage tail assembly protein [Neoroseomonas alba]MBW6399982.1 phage tail assembly protein [Neoroseomonas alba]
MTTTVPLTKPIEAHGETLSELTLREPTGKDIRLCGMPFRIGAEDGSIIIDTSAMAKMIGGLAGLPPSAIDKMPPSDWSAAMAAVLGFFGMAPAAS